MYYEYVISASFFYILELETKRFANEMVWIPYSAKKKDSLIKK